MTHADLVEKIPDASLREHVLKGSDEPVSVIIELAVPDPRVEYRDVDREGERARVPARVVPAGAREEKRLEKVASEARKLLDDLLAEPPVYLRSARAFVATATGRELEEIARSSLTRRIELNRSLPPHARASAT